MSRIQSYSPDIEHLKDIPGYQPILKSVLKSQIQFLVEQLSEQTGEESVLLTASITDGTLTHIGSSCGKVFLQDNEEFKSKFLGFCLKQQSKRKPEITSIPEESTTSSKRRRKNNEQTYPISIHKVNPSAQNVGSSTFRPFRTETITTDPHENFQTESREVDITSNKCTKEEIRTANETIQSCDFVVQKNVGYTDYSDQASIDKNVFQSNEAEDNEPNIVIKQEPIDSDTSLSSTAFTHGLTGSSWSSEKDACVSERPNRQDRQKPSSSKTQQLEDETQEGLLKKTSVSSLEQFGDVSQPSLNKEDGEIEKDGHMQEYINALLMEEGSGETEHSVRNSEERKLKLNEASKQDQEEEDSDSAAGHKKTLRKEMEMVETDESVTDLSDTECEEGTQDKLQSLEPSTPTQVGEREKKMCNVCGEEVYPRNFRRHMLRHEQVKLKCKTCSKLFSNETSLEIHEKNHVNQVQICNYCGKQYKRRSGVIEHIRLVHESNTNRSFTCTVCGKMFTRLGHLQNHMNTHSSEKPFSCMKCGRSYMSKTSLNFHEKQCEMEKKYKCKVCSNEFSSKMSLKEHKESEHNKRIYRCVCGLVFKWRPSLYRHKKTCWGANPPPDWSTLTEDAEDSSK